MSRPILYTSDSHFGHANIIKYTGRPFDDIYEMDIVMLGRLREAEASGAQIVHMGDVSFDLRRVVETLGWLERPQDHTLVIGNHDRYRQQREIYHSCFGRIIGTRNTWKTHSAIIHDGNSQILISHRPQEEIYGCQYNVYGHMHSRSLRSEVHLNACVELHDYRPVTLGELIATNIERPEGIIVEDHSRV